MTHTHTHPPTDAQDFDDIADEAAGNDFEGAVDYSAEKRDESGDDSKISFMFFDFRCPERWPANVDLLTPEAAEAIIQKKR